MIMMFQQFMNYFQHDNLFGVILNNIGIIIPVMITIYPSRCKIILIIIIFIDIRF